MSGRNRTGIKRTRTGCLRKSKLSLSVRASPKTLIMVPLFPRKQLAGLARSAVTKSDLLHYALSKPSS